MSSCKYIILVPPFSCLFNTNSQTTITIACSMKIFYEIKLYLMNMSWVVYFYSLYMYPYIFISILYFITCVYEKLFYFNETFNTLIVIKIQLFSSLKLSAFRKKSNYSCAVLWMILFLNLNYYSYLSFYNYFHITYTIYDYSAIN